MLCFLVVLQLCYTFSSGKMNYTMLSSALSTMSLCYEISGTICSPCFVTSYCAMLLMFRPLIIKALTSIATQLLKQNKQKLKRLMVRVLKFY